MPRVSYLVARGRRYLGPRDQTAGGTGAPVVNTRREAARFATFEEAKRYVPESPATEVVVLVEYGDRPSAVLYASPTGEPGWWYCDCDEFQGDVSCAHTDDVNAAERVEYYLEQIAMESMPHSVARGLAERLPEIYEASD